MIDFDGETRENLHKRIRRAPGHSSVPGSLPVLFFGDLFTAHVATVGINPSWQEYLSPDGSELDSRDRRFETLASLGATDRASLTDRQCEQAIATMRNYFRRDETVYRWFRPLNIILQGTGSHFQTGEVVHLDLVQEATRPKWSDLSSVERATLLSSDLLFFKWQLTTFPLRAIICNGRTPLDTVNRLLDARPIAGGMLGGTKWMAGEASIGDRVVGVAGWNIPLSQPGGLSDKDKVALGALFRSKLPAGRPRVSVTSSAPSDRSPQREPHTIIRPALSRDWPHIWPFYSQIVAAGETYAYPDPPDPEAARSLWMEGPPGQTVVAVEDDVVLGSAKMGPNRPGRGAHVATASFMVDPAHQGRGVGRALGDYAIRWARDAGYRSIQFNAVVETNAAAVHLWQSLGFQILATVPEAFDHPQYGLVGLHVMFRRL